MEGTARSDLTAVETLRDELEAERLRLNQRIDAAKAAGDLVGGAVGAGADWL